MFQPYISGFFKFKTTNILVCIFFLAGISNTSYSQEKKTIPENVNFHVFYGSALPELYSNKHFEILENPGLIGVEGEFILNDLVSFGMEISYATNKVVSKTPIISMEYINGSVEYTTIYQQYNYTIIRYVPTAGIHFIKTDKLDFLLKVGMGSYFLKGDNILADPRANTNSSQIPSFRIFSALVKVLFAELDKRGIPNTSRISVNGKYFFRENVAFDLGVGQGSGYLIHLGLTFKLN